MELTDAIRMAAQILDEERVRPTIRYDPIPYKPTGDGPDYPAVGATDVLSTLAEGLGHGLAWQRLETERKERPRRVHESPDEHQLKSTNCDLLRALFTQLQPSDRDAFVSSLLLRVPDTKSAHHRPPARYPSWNNYISELPLIAEFCVRVGSASRLFRVVAESTPTNGLAVLLIQLEDMIALNFNILSDSELRQLAGALGALRTVAHRQTYEFAYTCPTRKRNAYYKREAEQVSRHIVTTCDGLIAECQQARYWYLKGALQQTANLEVDHDKTRVEEHLKKLGFTEPLVQTLNAAEQLYRATATPFELKSCLAHLRSFLEGLHQQACQPIAEGAGAAVPTRWGYSTRLLRENGLLSIQEESLATALYTLISDEGVHPLMAEREYARLLRNVVIEYGLMFLSKLEKLGIKLH